MAETLELTLDQTQATGLYLILDIALDALNVRAKVLQEQLTIKPEERHPDLKEDQTIHESLKLTNSLIESAKEFSKEVGEIVIELEPGVSGMIIPSPKFKQDEK